MLTSRRPTGCSARPATFYIDPWNPVTRALITHAHGDHARPGSAAYLCASRAPRSSAGDSEPMPAVETTSRTAQPLTIGDVRVSFHPAGHVLGSAQIRLEGAGRRLGRGGRLQARRRPDLRAVRAGPLRHLRHRIDVRPADLPLGFDRERHQRRVRLVAGERRRAATSVLFCYTIGKAQRAAGRARGTDRPAGVRPRHDAADDRGLSRGRRRDAAGGVRRPSSRAARRSPASSSSRRCRRAARRGCAGWARTPTRSPRA